MNDNIVDINLDKKDSGFFRRLDWSAFWTGTVISFLVYFFTLAPTVTLEDSGELITAGVHWGVPHPPGYPIWTFFANLFNIAFQWVTFRGQPTPAWSIALMSAVFGAFATGLTAMLITRSSSDILQTLRNDGNASDKNWSDVFSWAGGVAGSLVFAFSPVMWSQATIVEVYSLNALFLMWVFLLTYRWMRQPSDKIIWLVAFVFGLGLTNYQVLLLAALPLVIVILFRNVSLFRDFIMLAIPFGLTMLVLQQGALPANTPGFAKLPPLPEVADAPSTPLIVAGIIIFMLGVGVALILDVAKGRLAAVKRLKQHIVAVLFGVGLVLMLFSMAFTHKTFFDPTRAPLVHPAKYLMIGIVLMAIIGCTMLAATASTQESKEKNWVTVPVAIAILLILVLFVLVVSIPSAPSMPLPPPSAQVKIFSWTLPSLAFFGGIALTFLLLWRSPRGLFYALAVFAVQGALFGLVKRGVLLGLTHPTTWWFWVPVIWNFLLLALAGLMLPNGRTTALSVLFAELGLSFYIYMPIVSDMNNPPMNWGYPRTWEGFKHAVTRGQYEKITPTNIFNKRFIEQLGSYFKDLRVQFTLLVAPLGFISFALWRLRAGKRTFKAMPLAVALFLVSCIFVLIGWHSDFDEKWRFDKVLIAAIMFLVLVGLVAMGIKQITQVWLKTWRGRNISEIIMLGLVLAGVGAVLCGFVAYLLAIGVWKINMEEPDASIRLLLAYVLSAIGLIALYVLGIWLVRHVQRWVKLEIEIDDVMQQWFLATVIGFLTMSLFLIILANPKGDLQDNFIQKVKFVSSHALFAIWIGYGLVFGLRVFDIILRKMTRAGVDKSIDDSKPFKNMVSNFARVVAVLGVLAVSAIPIYENFNNDQLIFEFGSAEQNGHDYGWQFGNYQLRGAEAISEELDSDEEPLPNPLYPPEMTPDAIFFGGTDPGRFVPTYMIYCADVRPDVFLITQNALADNTYMSVMRDLYGDQIYIPTSEDSGKAFQIYVHEVESGKRPRNADLVIENNRVQVSGALGVMEINGILCDMIFKNNIARHDFYIEESYVISWMFPYLAPHGLIMQIRQERGSLSSKNIQDDMEFWDWYTRRLMRDERFRRDIVAQKSFSKLRSAIGGLYAYNGMRANAEQAFQEARILYPVSPEANFRLVQEILLQQGRFDEAYDIIDTYNKADYNNERGKSVLEWIANMRNINKKIQDLLTKSSATGALDPNSSYEIGMCYRELGNVEAAARYIEPLASMTNLPKELMFAVGVNLSSFRRHESAVRAMDQVANNLSAMPAQQLIDMVRVYEAAQRPDRMVAPLARYLKIRPGDWKAWLDLATLYVLNKQDVNAKSSLKKAIELGREEAIKAASSSEILRPMLPQVIQQRSGKEQQQSFPFMRR